LVEVPTSFNSATGITLPRNLHDDIDFQGIENTGGQLTRQPTAEYGKTLKEVSLTLIFDLAHHRQTPC